MSGDIPPHPNAPSWRGAQLSAGTTFTFTYLWSKWEWTGLNWRRTWFNEGFFVVTVIKLRDPLHQRISWPDVQISDAQGIPGTMEWVSFTICSKLHKVDRQTSGRLFVQRRKISFLVYLSAPSQPQTLMASKGRMTAAWKSLFKELSQ
jgi:hypothetical protein